MINEVSNSTQEIEGGNRILGIYSEKGDLNGER